MVPHYLVLTTTSIWESILRHNWVGIHRFLTFASGWTILLVFNELPSSWSAITYIKNASWFPFISQLTYALPVLGPSLKDYLCSHLLHLCNRAIRVVCGLRKYGHVSNSRCALGWLSLDNLHHAVNSMYCHYALSDCVVFNPAILSFMWYSD